MTTAPVPDQPGDQNKTHEEASFHRYSSCPLLLPRSFSGKLIISLFIILGLGIIAIISTNYAMWHIQEKSRIIESFFELNQNVFEMRRHEKNYLLYNNKDDLISALSYLDQVRASVVTAQRFTRSKKDLQTFYDEELGKYESICRQLISDKSPLNNKNVLKETLRTHGQDITRQIFDIDARARKQVEQTVVFYRKIGVLILYINSVLGILLIFFLVRWIMRPLKAIREAAAQVMQGKMDFIPIVKAVNCSVEGIELVNSLNLMLKALNNKQEQLFQSEKLAAIGNATAGIAHEINNPLNNISLTAEVLMEELPDAEDSERMEMVREILAQADRARDVVHRLLVFSRSNKSKVKTRFDLVSLMENSLALVKNQLRMGGVNYDFDHPKHPVEITGNSHHLQQVMINMILNAVQAMPVGGHLQLGVEEKDGKAGITICDTGNGISPEKLPHIFDPFYTTKSDGTGLGLSLSYGIIKDHHGDIKVDSEVNNGTTFYITLPQDPQKEK